MSSFFKKLVFGVAVLFSSTYCSYDTTQTKEELFKTIRNLSTSESSKNLAKIGSLLKTFGDINAQDSEGNTVLHYAATCKNNPLIALLIKHGASLHIENALYVTSLQILVYNNSALDYTILSTIAEKVKNANHKPDHLLKNSNTNISSPKSDFFNAIYAENKQQTLNCMRRVNSFVFDQGCKIALENKKLDFFFFLLQNSPKLNATLGYLLDQPCMSTSLSNDLFLDSLISLTAEDDASIPLLISYFVKTSIPKETSVKALQKLATLPALDELNLINILHYVIKLDDTQLLACIFSIRALSPTVLEKIVSYACENGSIKCLSYTLSTTHSSALAEKVFLDYYTPIKGPSTYTMAGTRSLPLILLEFGISKEVLTEALSNALIQGSYKSAHELLSFGAQITQLSQEAFSQALDVNLQLNRRALIEILVTSRAHMACLSQSLKNMLLAYSLEKQNQLLIDPALAYGADIHLIQQHLETFTRDITKIDAFNTVLETVKLPLHYCKFNQKQEVDFINRALRRATLRGLTQAVDCLLELGADIHCADSLGTTEAPLKGAATSGGRQLVEYLLNKMEPNTETLNVCLRNSATQGHLPVVELLLQRGACLPNLPALMGAIKYNRLTIIRKLLTSQQDCVQTLSAVTRETSPAIVKLLQSFDSPNHRRLQAVIQSHSQVKTEEERHKCLIELRALAQLISGNLQNSQGNTALHLAVLYNNPQLVKELLALGAQPCIKNWQHQTPFDLAKTVGSWNCIQVFLQAYYTE